MRNSYLLFLFLLISGCASVEYNILTGKENLSFISDEKEIKLGRKISQQIAKEFKIVKNPSLRNEVNEIGYSLVNVCDRKSVVYHFTVIDDKKKGNKDPNAFALPGGYVYINVALLNMLHSKDEIAAVLAHEISHIVLRHSILKLQEAIGTQALLAILVTKASDVITVRRSQAALALMLLAYSKEREFEADRLGLKYLIKAGYNPQAMIEVLNKLKEYEFKSPIGFYHMRTHPYIDERIQAIKEELETGIKQAVK